MYVSDKTHATLRYTISVDASCVQKQHECMRFEELTESAAEQLYKVIQKTKRKDQKQEA